MTGTAVHKAGHAEAVVHRLRRPLVGGARIWSTVAESATAIEEDR